MPHAVFDLGSQAATADLAARRLIPGIEPGGSRAGQDTKPALLLIDAYLELHDIDVINSNAATAINVYLKLSQEQSLDPGLLLLIATIAMDCHQATNASLTTTPVVINKVDYWRGTIWAPKYVGIRLVEDGDDWQSGVDLDVHLDYEVVDVPFMDWFLMWEWLDGITDNSREY